MKNVSNKKGKPSIRLNAKLILLIAIGLILLLSPLYLRINKPLMGSEPYFYQRIIKNIETNSSMPTHDSLSFAGRDFTYNLGPIFLLYMLSKGVSITLLLQVIPILLGILTLILAYFSLRRLRSDPSISFISVMLLILSPSFLYAFTKFTNLTIALPLTLTAFYLFLSEKKFPRTASSVLFVILPFFGFWETIIPLSILGIYSIKNKEAQKRFIKISLITLAVMVVIHLPHIIETGSLGYIPKTTENVSNILFDIGGEFGASIFAVILAFFGLSRLWKKKYQNFKPYMILIALIIFSLLSKNGAIYLNFILCFLASRGLLRLSSMRWESKETRNVTLFLLLCGLIFSGLSFVGSIGSKYPTNQMVDSLKELESVSESQDIILSHQSNSAWINEIAKRKTIINERTAHIRDVEKIFSDISIIFHSRNIKQTEALLKKHKIKYVYITPNMKEGLVWDSQDEGFLFVSKYSKLLERKYEENEIEIWRIKQ